MTNNETKLLNKMKEEYSPKLNEPSDIEKLKELDKRVKRPAQILAYSIGTIGALVLGTGMTMAMGLIPGGMAAGITVGCIGILVAGLNYKLHGMVLNSRKQRYSKEILELTDTALQANNK